MSNSTPMHHRAIDWAIDKGYVLSVQDYECNPDPRMTDEWDVQYTRNRADIIAACDATELPNVTIYQTFGPGHKRITTFSVIDEGIPSEAINDYTCSDDPLSIEFDEWFGSASDDY